MALLGLAVVLLLARVALAPLVGLPLNYLVVLAMAAASGLVVLYAVVLRHERSIAVVASLVLGLVVGLFLLLETRHRREAGPPSQRSRLAGRRHDTPGAAA